MASRRTIYKRTGSGTYIGTASKTLLNPNLASSKLDFNTPCCASLPNITDSMRHRTSTPYSNLTDISMFTTHGSPILGTHHNNPSDVYFDYLQTLMAETIITDKLNQSAVEIDSKLSMLSKQLAENRGNLIDTYKKIKSFAFLFEQEAVLDNLFEMQTSALSAMHNKSTTQVLTTLKAVQQQCCNQLSYNANTIHIDSAGTTEACSGLSKSVGTSTFAENVNRAAAIVQHLNVATRLQEDLEVVTKSTADNLARIAQLSLQNGSAQIEIQE